MAGRMHTITSRVPTAFSTVHVHVNFDHEARPHEVAVSVHGKHTDSAVGKALEDIGIAITKTLQDFQQAQAAQAQAAQDAETGDT